MFCIGMATYIIKYDKYNQNGILTECVELCNSKTELHTKIQELYEKSGYYKELPQSVDSKNGTIKMITVYDILMNREECNWVDDNCELFEASGKKTAQQYKEIKETTKTVDFSGHMSDIHGYL